MTKVSYVISSREAKQVEMQSSFHPHYRTKCHSSVHIWKWTRHRMVNVPRWSRDSNQLNVMTTPVHNRNWITSKSIFQCTASTMYSTYDNGKKSKNSATLKRRITKKKLSCCTACLVAGKQDRSSATANQASWTLEEPLLLHWLVTAITA